MTALQPVPGAAGANGAGAIGTDVWASQGNPGAVADWGTVINTLITGGARLLSFSDHDFPFTTQINLNNKYAITFQGTGGALHPTVGGSSDRPGARLIWKSGAGSGIAISANGSDGIVFRDMGVNYDNVAYNGDLMQFDFSASQAANAVIERCSIGGTSLSAATSARSVLKWTNAVTCTVEECSIYGAQVGIRGFETLDVVGNAPGAQHPDNNRIVHNTFWNIVNAHIANVGRYWTIEDNEFLYGSLGGAATVAGVTSDITCTSDFSYINNRNWDFANGTQKAIQQPSTATWTARIKGNFFDTHNAVNIDLAGPGIAIIEDNGFARAVSNGGTYLIDLGSSVSAYKNYVRIKGNSWSASSSPANVIANLTGHGMLDIGPNSENQGQEALAVHVRSLGGIERACWSPRYVPSAALAAGQPAITIDGKTQDGFGYLTFQIPGGSPSVAGKLATVTFGQTLIKGHGSNPPDATHQVALVYISPYAISNDVVSVANTISAGFFAQVTGAQSTTFDIYTANAIPAAAKVGIAYRVVSM